MQELLVPSMSHRDRSSKEFRQAVHKRVKSWTAILAGTMFYSRELFLILCPLCPHLRIVLYDSSLGSSPVSIKSNRFNSSQSRSLISFHSSFLFLLKYRNLFFSKMHFMKLGSLFSLVKTLLCLDAVPTRFSFPSSSVPRMQDYHFNNYEYK